MYILSFCGWKKYSQFLVNIFIYHLTHPEEYFKNILSISSQVPEILSTFNVFPENLPPVTTNIAVDFVSLLIRVRAQVLRIRTYKSKCVKYTFQEQGLFHTFLKIIGHV